MAYGIRDPFLEGQPGPGPGPNPLGPVMEPGLRAIIYSVQHHLCSQSVFFADRMLNAAASLDAFGTNSPAAVALELWADTLLRAGEYEQVRWQLRGKNLSPRLQYLLAVACIKLEQFQEAQVALLGGDLDLVELWSSHGHLSSLDHVVEGAAGLYQLGQVAEGLRKREQAYECYAKCLKLCPFMWCAFERLSWLSLCLRNKAPSQNPREFAAGVFEHDRLMKNDILFPQSEVCKAVTPSEKCGFRTPRKRRRSGSLHSMPSAQSAKSLSPFGPRFSPRLPLLDKNPVTPIRTWSPSKVRGVFSPQSLASPKSPKKCHRYTPGLPGAVPTEEPNQTHIVHPIDSIDSIDSIMHRMRKTVCNVCNTVRSDTGCSGCSGCRGRGKGEDENGDSLRSFSTLLQGLGEALHSLHRFRCQEAIDAVKTLHLNEQRSAFCEDLVARCHFEMQNYEETVRSYGRCCVQHRFFRSFGFEYFSTALWQLGDRLELGNLSRQVLEWGRSRPRAWCVLGNCFSLNNEEEAIKFFKRAIQLDPNLVYAYSLIGHELVSMEKYEKAIEMFQAAIDLDPRQYNAWWGLGDVFQRQEDFAQAKYNFLRALDINPSNQVLKISLGAVLQEMGQANEALQLLSSAGGAVSSSRALAFLQKGRNSAAPRNTMKHAITRHCLLCLEARHSEAVEELRRACYLAPKEPGIHFHLGCACRSLGDSVTALKHFTFALDLANDRHLTDATRKELRELRGQSA